MGFRVYINPDDDLLQAQAEALQTSYPARFQTAEDQPYLFDHSSTPQLAGVQCGERVQFLLDEADSLRVHAVRASEPTEIQVRVG